MTLKDDIMSLRCEWGDRCAREEAAELAAKREGELPWQQERLGAFLGLLRERAKELCPDYPFQDSDDAFTYLWALTASLTGTVSACEDLHKIISYLRPDLREGTPCDQLRRISELSKAAGIESYTDAAREAVKQ